MISVIAQAVYSINSMSKHYNVYFESIGGIRAKYCVVQNPNLLRSDCDSLGIFYRLVSDISVKTDEHGTIEVTLNSPYAPQTVKTDYTAMRKVDMTCKLYVDTTMKQGRTTHVCRM